MVVEVLRPVERETDYRAYTEAGGKLSEPFYDDAMRTLQRTLDMAHLERERARVEQAQRMAGDAEIVLSPAQISVYVDLRRQRLKEGAAESTTSEEGVHPWSLGDQPLLAEVLKLTHDDTQLLQFTSRYSHIFSPKQEGERNGVLKR